MGAAFWRSGLRSMAAGCRSACVRGTPNTGTPICAQVQPARDLGSTDASSVNLNDLGTSKVNSRGRATGSIGATRPAPSARRSGTQRYGIHGWECGQGCAA